MGEKCATLFRKLFLFAIIICQVIGLPDDQKLPFCQICTCVFPNNNLPAELTCTKDVKDSITNNAFWIDKETNTSYDYSKVTFSNNNFLNLTYKFPKSNLTYMNLANNDIFTITESVFQNLQNMQTLILSYNDMELLHPDALKGLYMEEELMPLRSLKELRLDHNRLHSLNQNLFEHTTYIEVLDLSHNIFKQIDKHTAIAITSLVYLRELDLSYTEIQTLPDSMLHRPRYLKVLDLSGNPINKIPDTLADSWNLTTLYLNNTGFTNITKENGFPKLPTVKVLYMCNVQTLQRIEKESMSGLENLEELYVCDNIDLTHFDEFALAQINDKSGGTIWPALKKLSLANNKLAYIDPELIARWDGLSQLDLRENPWTCECENQWLIDDLMPLYLKIDKEKALELRCAAPIEMAEFTFYDLYLRKYQMRCLDEYGARPENDATMLVGILAGVLLAIPLLLLAVFAYQRKWFSICGICDSSPASYSRRFYSATAKTDDYL